jgi:uncharacterized phage-associated protein
MRTCFDIIPYLLQKSISLGYSGFTPLKLQKILYYCQAWNLVFKGKPLFPQYFEAWVHGPAIPEVYKKYKEFGFGVILTENNSSSIELENTEREIIDLVLNLYGKKHGKYLELLTHSEPPWIIARHTLLPNQLSKKKISWRNMMKYYSQLVETKKPPKIKASALQIRHDAFGKTTLENIASGMGTVLEISPHTNHYYRQYDISDFEGKLKQVEAIESVWEKVGYYLLESHESLDG